MVEREGRHSTGGKKKFGWVGAFFAGRCRIRLPPNDQMASIQFMEAPMRYTFLIYLDEVKFAGMPPEERDGYAAAMRDYDESLRQGGSLVFASALKLPREATTVRMWEG